MKRLARILSPSGCALASSLFIFAAALAQEAVPWDPKPTDTRPAIQPGLRPVFFPPTAPVFGNPIIDIGGRRTFNGRTFVAPIELAEDVGEFFYPPLGSRLYEQKLDEKLREQLAAYHAKRAKLLNELQDQLTTASTTDAAAREKMLREFAAKQTPRIVALETEADKLRQQLIRSAGYSADWDQKREWRLKTVSAQSPMMVPTAEYQVIRATVFYQSGLSPEQRGLLLEALEQRRQDRLPAVARNTDVTVIFFSPETARFRPPPALLHEVGPKIATFTLLKNELRRELVETVIAQDSVAPAKRTKVYEHLAESQWPQLSVLEALADEIRAALAALPPPPLPTLPNLPPPLAARIDAYKREQSVLGKEERECVAAVTFPAPPKSGELTNTDAVTRNFRERVAANIAAREAAVAQFRADNASRYEAQAETLKSIRADLEVFAKTQVDPKTGKPMDVASLMRRVNTADAAFEKIGREEVIYKNYRIAMLEPGLSPEQRRLLFTAALAGLAQPLPAGDAMPDGQMVRGGF